MLGFDFYLDGLTNIYGLDDIKNVQKFDYTTHDGKKHFDALDELFKSRYNYIRKKSFFDKKYRDMLDVYFKIAYNTENMFCIELMEYCVPLVNNIEKLRKRFESRRSDYR